MKRRDGFANGHRDSRWIDDRKAVVSVGFQFDSPLRVGRESEFENARSAADWSRQYGHADVARWMARHTRSGVTGMSMSATPSWRSAYNGKTDTIDTH